MPRRGIRVAYFSLGSGTEGVSRRLVVGRHPLVSQQVALQIVTCTGTMTSAQKKKTAAHELGHTIGLMHAVFVI